MTKLGSNSFHNCPVPLAFNGRYFILESGDIPLFSVVLLHKRQPVFEIIRNEPKQNPITDAIKNSTGIITVSDKDTGKFIYKFRPESETSIVFGKIESDDTITVTISDKSIKVGNSTFSNNTVIGCGAGIVVGSDGSIAMGASIPQELLPLFQG